MFPPAPPYPPDPLPAPAFDQRLTLNPGNGAGCATEPAGADGAGSFGWAMDQTGNCALQVGGFSFPAGAGIPVSLPCQAVLQNAQQSRAPILVPVYVSLNAGNYALKGFADFVVTGYNLLPGFSAADWLNPANTCLVTGCLTGYFVQGVSPFTGSLGGPDLGASVIDLTG